jgi:hypothetical protein
MNREGLMEAESKTSEDRFYMDMDKSCDTAMA